MSEKESDGWVDGSREHIKAFFRNGLGKVDRVRLIRSLEATSAPKPVSRGKGKKRKPWEGRYG